MKVTEYLYGLLSGVDPETGEVVDLSDPNISKAILELALLTQDGLSYKKDGGENLLQYPSEKLFNELKTWRLEEAYIQGLPAYYIFSDRELREIANGDIERKEDLILVKGINRIKYDNYGEAIYNIINDVLSDSGWIMPESLKEPAKEKENSRTLEQILDSRENCVSYRRGDCNGMRCLCEEYERAFDISEEEIANWPKLMDASAQGKDFWTRYEKGRTT